MKKCRSLQQCLANALQQKGWEALPPTARGRLEAEAAPRDSKATRGFRQAENGPGRERAAAENGTQGRAEGGRSPLQEPRRGPAGTARARSAS